MKRPPTNSLPVERNELTSRLPEWRRVVITARQSRTLGIKSREVIKVVLDPIALVLSHDPSTRAVGNGKLLALFILNQFGKSLILDSGRVDQQVGERRREGRFLLLLAIADAQPSSKSGKPRVGIGRRGRIRWEGFEGCWLFLCWRFGLLSALPNDDPP